MRNEQLCSSGDRGFKWWCASKIAKSPLDNLSL